MTDLTKLADQIERSFAGHEDIAAEIAEFVRNRARVERYEGYTNYATAMVALDLANTKAFNDQTKRMVNAEYEFKVERWDALRDYYTSLLDVDKVNVRASSMLNAGLNEVNWQEIVESWND